MESLPLADTVIGVGVAVLILRMVFDFIIKARNGRRNHNPNGNPGHSVTLAENQRVGLDDRAHDKMQRIEDGIGEANRLLAEVLVLLRPQGPR